MCFSARTCVWRTAINKYKGSLHLCCSFLSLDFGPCPPLSVFIKNCPCLFDVKAPAIHLYRRQKTERKKILLLLSAPILWALLIKKILLLVSVFSFSFFPAVYHSHLKFLGLHGSTADYQGIAAPSSLQDGIIMCPPNHHNVIIDCAPE